MPSHPCPSSAQRRPEGHGPGKGRGDGKDGRDAREGRARAPVPPRPAPHAARPAPHDATRAEGGREGARETGRGQSPAGPRQSRIGARPGPHLPSGGLPASTVRLSAAIPAASAGTEGGAGRGGARSAASSAGAGTARQDPPRGGGSARHFRGRSRAGRGGAPRVPWPPVSPAEPSGMRAGGWEKVPCPQQVLPFSRLLRALPARALSWMSGSSRANRAPQRV